MSLELLVENYVNCIIRRSRGEIMKPFEMYTFFQLRDDIETFQLIFPDFNRFLINVLLRTGDRYLASKEKKIALHLFQEAKRFFPQISICYLKEAECHIAMGSIDQVYNTCKRAIKYSLETDINDVISVLGLLIGYERISDARKLLLSLLQRFPYRDDVKRILSSLDPPVPTYVEAEKTNCSASAMKLNSKKNISKTTTPETVLIPKVIKTSKHLKREAQLKQKELKLAIEKASKEQEEKLREQQQIEEQKRKEREEQKERLRKEKERKSRERKLEEENKELVKRKKRGRRRRGRSVGDLPRKKTESEVVMAKQDYQRETGIQKRDIFNEKTIVTTAPETTQSNQEFKSPKEKKKNLNRSISLTRMDSQHGLRMRSESNSINCSQALSTTNRFSVVAPDDSLSVVSSEHQVSKNSAFSKDIAFTSSSNRRSEAKTFSSMSTVKYDRFLEESKDEWTEVGCKRSRKSSISFPERRNSHCESEELPFQGCGAALLNLQFEISLPSLSFLVAIS
ncbi:stress response protein NST1-like [Xenia sp. Carnegie-2017]|uniref:stress response protein NST1-like n=1 Tax=Xenia sp. Carnegie-2017 TaxID=2897299 RepID=UPI001F04560B|nr:stress response protein NST1-like [Xenia sp. Carnegie-2017]